MANNNDDLLIRAALRIILDDTRKPYKLDKEAIAKICKDALSRPVRNCDVGTPEEQERRFDKFCDSHDCKSDCPLFKVDSCCEFMWAQMPYNTEEGIE